MAGLESTPFTTGPAVQVNDQRLAGRVLQRLYGELRLLPVGVDLQLKGQESKGRRNAVEGRAHARLGPGPGHALEQVQFATAKSTIRKQSYELLNEVAQILITYPKIKKVLIEGHTDDRGRDKYNLRLSQARAKAVRTYLIKKGIDAERLTAQGFGETKPKVPNDSAENRQINRRVVFTITEKED